jgi:hypothetical protein
MRVSQTAFKSSTSNIAASAHHSSLMTPPPTPIVCGNVPPRGKNIRYRHDHGSEAERRAENTGAKTVKKLAQERRRHTHPVVAAQDVGVSQTNKGRKTSNRKDKATERADPQSLCSSPHSCTPSGGNDDGSLLHAAQQKLTATCNHLPYKDGHDTHISSHSTITRSPLDQPLDDTEASHDLEVDCLMTLHLQRTQALTASPNTLEKLLATDNPPDDHVSPAMRATHEFLLGMQHEQSELWVKTEELETQIAAIRNRNELASLENMLGLDIALSIELLLEEGAFRDAYERKRGCEGWDLEREFENMRARVGKVIGEYDKRIEKLRMEAGGK